MSEEQAITIVGATGIVSITIRGDTAVSQGMQAPVTVFDLLF